MEGYYTAALSVVLLLINVRLNLCHIWDNLNLPHSHIPYYFSNNPSLRADCQKDDNCIFKELLQEDKCWGYEPSRCEPEKRLKQPNCSGESQSWAHRKTEQIDHFWRNADFGIVADRKKELKVYCKPNSTDDSSLKCSANIRYCEAKNIFIDLTTSKINGVERNRYREDVLSAGQIGGHCDLDAKSLKSQGEHKSPLQSWFAEIEHFSSVNFYPSKGEKCDIVFEKPTYVIKLDAAINMYHHFCDFVNLYVSQHINNSFDTDINIIMWDTSVLPYHDPFRLTWKAFSDHSVIPLKDLDGKKVCLKDAVFPLLARQRLGLYYNMPVMPGCSESGLFQAFHEHIVHRLGIAQDGPLKDKIRITLLDRKTQFRNIMNQNELASAMKTVGEFEVTVIDYNWQMPFEDQLKISHNSDIFIGMHGAGLTHMLFQPDWAAVFELYNCEDANCYYDLARLRGIEYLTWERKDKLVQEDEGHHPTLGAHAKFTNYGFDVDEFMRLIHKAATHVRTHPAFIQARRHKYGGQGETTTTTSHGTGSSDDGGGGQGNEPLDANQLHFNRVEL